MKSQNKNLRVTTRLLEKTRLEMEQLVVQGKFKNLSEVIRKALDELLCKEFSSQHTSKISSEESTNE